jgi:hypothetical protein
MQLRLSTLTNLAEMICGASGNPLGEFDWPGFPYRSSFKLTRFIFDCDLEYERDASTRRHWFRHVLTELNGHPASGPRLPADSLVRGIEVLMAPENFKDDDQQQSDQEHQFRCWERGTQSLNHRWQCPCRALALEGKFRPSPPSIAH